MLTGVVLTADFSARLAVFPRSRMPADDCAAEEGDFVTHDFKFSDGQSLPEVRLHYTTIGTPQRDAGGRVTNAVLILHGTNRAAACS